MKGGCHVDFFLNQHFFAWRTCHLEPSYVHSNIDTLLSLQYCEIDSTVTSLFLAHLSHFSPTNEFTSGKRSFLASFFRFSSHKLPEKPLFAVLPYVHQVELRINVCARHEGSAVTRAGMCSDKKGLEEREDPFWPYQRICLVLSGSFVFLLSSVDISLSSRRLLQKQMQTKTKQFLASPFWSLFISCQSLQKCFANSLVVSLLIVFLKKERRLTQTASLYLSKYLLVLCLCQRNPEHLNLVQNILQ